METNQIKSIILGIYLSHQINSESNIQQEDLLDLKTALLKFNYFLSTTVATQCTFESNP